VATVAGNDIRVDIGETTVVVTGVAGFIGHHTAALLLDWGCTVIGIDGFTDYYGRDLKERNLDVVRQHPRFTFVEAPLDADSCAVFATADAVIHLAAQPGVRDSWTEFETYVRQNLLVTKVVLDAALQHGVERLVYASSSSVLGEALTYPTHEDAPTEPRSPYGITKLAGERLAVAYAHERGLSTVSLRYFTVFGPRQRPDMAIQRLIVSALESRPFTMFGDGSQIRDFTYVGDVARANALAALRPQVPAGSVFNVCGEESITLREVVDTVVEATGRPVRIEKADLPFGDVRRTGGSSAAIRESLGWSAQVPVRKGIDLQVAAQLEGSAAA
jgi:nucleoside-diphosphate-sugar epimerase